MPQKEEELRNENLRQVYKRIIRMFVGFALFFLLVGGIVIIVGWATENIQIIHSGWGFVVLGFCVLLLALVVWVVRNFSRIESKIEEDTQTTYRVRRTLTSNPLGRYPSIPV